MKKITTILVAMFIAFSSYAQTGLYEALEQNGADAEYLEFYHVSKGESEGTTKVSGESKWGTVAIDVADNGAKTGFTFTKTDGSGDYSFSLLYRNKEAVGYPNVSYIKSDDDGVIVVGDYIIELEDISADGTSFKSIDRVFVKKQVKEEKEKSTEGEEKKKGKFGAGLKNLAAKVSDAGMSLELKKVTNEDLFKIATDYLVAMKAKQNAYTLTSADKADIAKVKALVTAKYAKIDKANADYWNSDAGKAVYDSYGNGSSSNSTYTIKNTTGATVQVGSNGVGGSYLESGSTKKVDCGKAIYIMKLNGNSLEQSYLISDGSKCGETINF